MQKYKKNRKYKFFLKKELLYSKHQASVGAGLRQLYTGVVDEVPKQVSDGSVVGIGKHDEHTSLLDVADEERTVAFPPSEMVHHTRMLFAQTPPETIVFASFPFG